MPWAFVHRRRAKLMILIAGVAAGVGLAACGDSPIHRRVSAGATPVARAHASTRIAFVVERDYSDCIEGCPDPPQIYSVGVSGRQPAVLLTGADAPAYSSSGERLAANTSTGHFGDIPRSRLLVAAADGTGQRQLVGGHFPAWSPGGDQIVFERGDGDTIRSIYFVAADGGAPRRLVEGSTPAWSANGVVAFARATKGDSAIAVMRPPRGRPRDLTKGHEDDNPDWSPDGRRIAFDRSFLRAQWIYTINREGRGRRRLHQGEQPAWSPDGRRIAFIGVDGGLLVMRANGSGVHSIIAPKTFEKHSETLVVTLGHPVWIPSR
jgi:Tol biopolymer transport system component